MIRFSIFYYLLLLVACDQSMIKELDIELPALPDKLSVTAILNGQGVGVFEIKLMEGISIDKYKPTNFNKTKIRNGEIRLYEDSRIILSIPGPFDMSTEITEHGDGWKWGKNGYHHILTGINTNPGSIYRLEVEVEGFPMAVSTSTMPAASLVSASVDTSVQVIRKNVKEIGSASFYLNSFWGFTYENYPDRYWPLSVNMDVSGVNQYFALDIIKSERNIDRNMAYMWGIGSSDAIVLFENFVDSELMSNKQTDLYLFSMLMASSNLTFSGKNASGNFYAAVDEKTNNQKHDHTYLDENPDFEKITTQHLLMLRVRSISPAIYRYYQDLTLQYNGGGGLLGEQTATVVGNIENGYGSFAVYNTVNISLLEWETYEWREKKE